MTPKSDERGAALVIVLLLVATLSFVLLSLTTIVTTGVRRGANERARTEMLWQALAAEQLALSLLEEAISSGALQTATSEGGLFKQQLALPIERGAAALRLADASRCFNVNSLIAKTPPYTRQAPQYEEFAFLLEGIGLGGNEVESVAETIASFLETGVGQGSEDGFYTGLATPFRTADGPIASVSELRSMDGITREIYVRLAPFLCARRAGEKIEINVSALTPEDAPLIFAAAGGLWPVEQIRSRIGETPPGGWDPAATFWAGFTGGAPPAGALTGNRSTWVEARVLLEANKRFVEETLIIETPTSGQPKLYARVFGGGS